MMRYRRSASNALTRTSHAAWWLEPSSFKGLRRPFLSVYYVGALSGHDTQEAQDKPRRLQLGPGGVILSSALHRLFLLPWADISAIDIEGADDGDAVLVVRMKKRDEGRFVIDGVTSLQLQGKLARIIALIESSRQGAATLQSNLAPSMVLNADLARLARLHDAGELTDAEFAAARSAVLAGNTDDSDK